VAPRDGADRRELNPTVRAHNLDSATAQSATLFRQLRNDHRRHKSGNIAELPFAIRLRQAKSSWLEIPCRRAGADASRGPEKLSSTIRSLPVTAIQDDLMW
jgi:hypothetical protein